MTNQTMKHTPGPWIPKRVGYTWSVRTKTHDLAPYSEEDARLIACAPEMLEVLRMVQGCDIHHEVLRAVDAVVAKATGATP
jgi:hypothetical protein